jgi:molybdopterin synthase catalytic subunit
VTRESIDPGALLGAVGAPTDGAALLFVGTVRDHNDGRPVVGVRYEAYVEMADRVLGQIAAEAAELLGTDHVAVVHRVGELAIGEASVAIAVSSPHRAEAFDACRFVIEEIKRRVPVWKEERYAGDASPRWLAGVTPPRAEPQP